MSILNGEDYIIETEGLTYEGKVIGTETPRFFKKFRDEQIIMVCGITYLPNENGFYIPLKFSVESIPRSKIISAKHIQRTMGEYIDDLLKFREAI